MRIAIMQCQAEREQARFLDTPLITGYAVQQKVQPHLDRYVWDGTSKTGYKKWNKDTRQMEEVQPVMPNSTAPVWYQAKQNYYMLHPNL